MRKLIVVLAAGLALAAGLRARGADSGGDLKLVLIVSRHGVRAPTRSNAKDVELYSAQPSPRWDVPLEDLTPHGRRLMELMGAYYRALYTREGLLAGRTAEDAGRIYFLADSDERTIDSARGLGEGLLPGASPQVHARPQDVPDPLFRPQSFSAAHPDLAEARAALLGRIGGDPAVLDQAYRPEFDLLERILLGNDGPPPPGKRLVLGIPVSFQRGTHAEVISMTSPVHEAESLIDNFLLEYAEGMPMRDVAWGRMDRADLTRLLRLHALYFDLTQRTLYPARIQMSNMLSHILGTMEQAAAGRQLPGSFGSPADRIIVVVGHDSNQMSLGGLLGVHWWLPQTQQDPMLPGGALVFELRRRADGQWRVRLRYTSQSLEQMRDADVLTLDRPPLSAPIFIPGCSEPGPGYDAPLERFAALVRRVVDPAYVVSGNL